MDNFDRTTEIMRKVDELTDVLRQSKANAYGGARLPSETRATAAYLLERAMELVYEITGEEWEFSYQTW